jgi:hypothetical protein
MITLIYSSLLSRKIRTGHSFTANRRKVWSANMLLYLFFQRNEEQGVVQHKSITPALKCLMNLQEINRKFFLRPENAS